MSAIYKDDVKELLKLEYEYLTSLLIANEEMGDKRVALFVGLTAGLGAAAVLVRDKLGEGGGATFPEVFLAVSVAWLLFGYLTFSRVIYRNLKTDEIKVQLNAIRKSFVDESSPALPHLPYDPFEPVEPRPGLKFLRGRGGYAELVALMNAVLTGAVAWQAVHYFVGPLRVAAAHGTFGKVLAIAVAVIAAIGAWLLHAHEAANLYESKERAAPAAASPT